MPPAPHAALDKPLALAQKNTKLVQVTNTKVKTLMGNVAKALANAQKNPTVKKVAKAQVPLRKAVAEIQKLQKLVLADGKAVETELANIATQCANFAKDVKLPDPKKAKAKADLKSISASCKKAKPIVDKYGAAVGVVAKALAVAGLALAADGIVAILAGPEATAAVEAVAAAVETLAGAVKVLQGVLKGTSLALTGLDQAAILVGGKI